jgi:hypothetical protein
VSEVLIKTRHAMRIASVAIVGALKSRVFPDFRWRLMSAMGGDLMGRSFTANEGKQRGERSGNRLEIGWR